MIKDSKKLRARDYVAHLGTIGRHHFTIEEAHAALGVSAKATKMALGRLSSRDLIASPARGFYVVVPPEYQKLGCLPAEQFIPAQMKFEDRRYYSGLLSAAQFHGAAHHRPQEFQVMIEKPRRKVICGNVRISFHVRKNLSKVATKEINTPRGTVLISTPEATALDLVGYHKSVGGLDQVATVLSELAERIEPDLLLDAAKSAPVAWAQRLGFLLDLVERHNLTPKLEKYIQRKVRNDVPLLPTAGRSPSSRNKKWKLIVNAQVESEF